MLKAVLICSKFRFCCTSSGWRSDCKQLTNSYSTMWYKSGHWGSFVIAIWNIVKAFFVPKHFAELTIYLWTTVMKNYIFGNLARERVETALICFRVIELPDGMVQNYRWNTWRNMSRNWWHIMISKKVAFMKVDLLTEVL